MKAFSISSKGKQISEERMGLSRVRILMIFSSPAFKINTTMNKKGLKCVLFKNLFLSLIDWNSALEADCSVVKWRIREKFRTILS